MQTRSIVLIVLTYLAAGTLACASSLVAAAEATGSAAAPASSVPGGVFVGQTLESGARTGASPTPRPANSMGAGPRSEPQEGEAATLPVSLDSATLFQARPPVPLGAQAFMDASQEWARTGDAPVVVGTDGAVMYAYGQSRPVVTCAPLRICVIHLIAREHITNLSVGDSVRWLIQAADAGAGGDVTPVVVVKPTEADLITNLAITTDAGRIYYLTLHSDPRRYVPEIGFYDPQQIIVRLTQQRAAADAQVAAHQERVIDNLGAVDPASLDFDFACKAENRAARPWLPLRVFAAAGHTYLQMPDTLAYGDAPAIFNLVQVGHHVETELINSRLVHGYYVIDGLPMRFKLLVGAGKATRTVTCSHD